jgi:hypothetical protein
MPKALQIVILICVPLAWGLAVEFVFSHLLKRRQSAGPAKDREANDLLD